MPADTGWPLRLMPDAPPLEAWLWPYQAELISADGSNAVIAWQQQALLLRDQQVRQRSVQAWFPLEEWPPLTPAPHRGRDAVGLLRRLPVPGAAQTGLPVIVHGVGVRRDTAQPELAYAAARALQDTAPAFLPYTPFTAQETAVALQTRWRQLTTDQATAIAVALQLHLRPVWSVLSGPYFHDGWWSMGIANDAVPSEWNDRQYIAAWDLPSMVVRLVKALCQVLALGVAPTPQAAADVAHGLQNVLVEWATSPAR
jgi:hypothetical protein